MNVASVAAFTGAVGFASYSASKAYVVTLSESLAVRYASRGVSVMALCPGYVRTEMHDASSNPESGLVARLMWLDPEQLVELRAAGSAPRQGDQHSWCGLQDDRGDDEARPAQSACCGGTFRQSRRAMSERLSGHR